MKSKKITDEKKLLKNVFDELSEEWWDKDGGFSALHSYNPVRIDFILRNLKQNIKSKKVLDIGCGGGILCEPLARLEANVTGIDENEAAINTAKAHAKTNKLNISYFNTSIGKTKFKEKFDIITCMEVIEHVKDLKSLLTGIRNNLKPKGLFVGSTINKTLISYFSTIFLAENILKIVPKNTHKWSDYVKPNVLKKELIFQNFENFFFQGVIYNPIKKNWKLINNCSMNYMFSCYSK